MKVPLFYTTAFYISNKRKKKKYVIILSFFITYAIIFTETLLFPVDLNYWCPYPFQLKEPPLVFLLRKAC